MVSEGQTGVTAPLPERIGRYEVLLPIASGGMATVYLARTQGIGGFEREVAIKLTHAHLRENADFAADLLEEAKLAVRIRHSNVVSVIDIGNDPLGLFLVMDYVHGDTLSNLRKQASQLRQPLPLSVGLKILVDTLSGLHAAHELRDERGEPLGVVHRDYSPQNLLVGTDGVAQLTDFGIAKAATRLGHTATGIIKGKIKYMSPEQARGEPVDRRTDVWAAGIIAWELVAGRKLHPDDNDVGTLLRVVTQTPPRVSTVAPDVPRGIDDAIAWALTMDPAERCPTAAAFAQSITAACRANGLLADTLEVSAYVERLVGPKLAQRRTRVTEILSLRAQMGKLADAAQQHEEGAASASSSFVAAAPIELPLPAATPTRPDAPRAIPADGATVQASTQSTATTPWIGAQAAAPHVPVDREQAVTDTTSVTQPDLASATPARNTRAVAKYASVGVVVALLGAAGLAFGLRVSQPGMAAPGASATAQSSTPVAASSPSSAPSPSFGGQGIDEVAAPENAFVVVLVANAPVRALRINGRSLAVASPFRTLEVPLTSAEHNRECIVEATSVDGRTMTGTIAAGARSLTLQFAPVPTGAWGPPPLATNPYSKGK
jgi:eukaryotic-like serine/threonine-protein kinase